MSEWQSVYFDTQHFQRYLDDFIYRLSSEALNPPKRRVKVFGYNRDNNGALTRSDSGLLLKVFLGDADFHGFSINHNEFETGAGNYPVAIVEFDDGTVDDVPLHLIQFKKREEGKPEKYDLTETINNKIAEQIGKRSSDNFRKIYIDKDLFEFHFKQSDFRRDWGYLIKDDQGNAVKGIDLEIILIKNLVDIVVL